MDKQSNLTNAVKQLKLLPKVLIIEHGKVRNSIKMVGIASLM